ncbi:alpha/beta fold hydrolase [Ktedonosporobacter rubrisoli]|uniref:Alpha/beta fold hydrolase n=1 Tax=Ktedonosporobacter rubrisoli TaxID=2509675 RepID=A0A4P6JK05_KTERU|nr:alpha/beta fold hydrolase [Ktedonosporobacter rubrisoli]QBD75497.1 alpha/beta fold hydrolase [Ktedonosporobacter rubrisoli]
MTTLIIIFMLVLLLLCILCLGLTAWLASTGLRVKAARPPVLLPVLAVAPETVTLPRLPKTSVDGISGLAWQDNFAVLGEVVALEAQSVTRRIIQASQLPEPGSQVRWNKFVYHGDPQSALGLTFEEVRVPGPLGELAAWQLAGQRETWLVLVHGFHATREEALRALPTIARQGFPALVLSYRNDPGAPCSPDQLYHLGDTEWQDVEAGVRYALAQGARDVIVFGWSMGGSIVETFLHRSAYAAQVRAVILDSPILNWQRVLQAQLSLLHLPRWLGSILRMMVEWRAQISFAKLNYEHPSANEREIPTLLLHSTADALVPVTSSDIFARTHSTCVTYRRMEEAEHTLLWNLDPQAYENDLAAFLQRMCAPQASLRNE